MRKILFLLALVPLAVGGPAEVRRGVVLDPAGRPLQGVTVWLRSPDGCCTLVPGHSARSAETAADGGFTFAAPHAEMEVYVSHPDYAPGWQRLADGAVVRLEDPAFVVGNVSAAATLRAARGLWPVATVQADGEFRLGPLPVGVPLTLSVDSPGHRPETQRVALAAGEVRRIDFALDAGLSLRGRLRPAVAGAVIRASQGEPRESRATSGPDGSFELTGLRAGPVRLVVLAPGRDPVIVDGTAGVHLDVELER